MNCVLLLIYLDFCNHLHTILFYNENTESWGLFSQFEFNLLMKRTADQYDEHETNVYVNNFATILVRLSG